MQKVQDSTLKPKQQGGCKLPCVISGCCSALVQLLKMHGQVSLCLALSYYQNNLADREATALPYCFVCLLACLDLAYLMMRFCFSPLWLASG